MIFLVISAIGIFSLIFMGVFSSLIKRKLSSQETYTVEAFLEKAIKDQEMNTLLRIAPKTKSAYDGMKDIIELRNKNDFETLVEGFHEFGHAVDLYKRNLMDKYNGAIWGVIFYLFKYSIPLGVFFHSIYINIEMLEIDSLSLEFNVLTFLFYGMGLFFSILTLKEEIIASSYALKFMPKIVDLSEEKVHTAKMILAKGLTSYIFIFIIAITLFTYHLLTF